MDNRNVDCRRAIETACEEVKDAVNILQLLSVELEANEDDGHVRRTVSIVEKMLQEAAGRLQQASHGQGEPF